MDFKRKRIVWITENYVDVDYPIIHQLKEKYEIIWLISHHERSCFFSDCEYARMKEELGIDIRIHKTKRRNRNTLNIFHYYRLLKVARQAQPTILYLNILGFPYFHILRVLFFPQKLTVYAAHDVVEHSGLKYRGMIQIYKAFIFNSIFYFQTFSESQERILHRNYIGKQSFVGRLCLKDYGKPNAWPNDKGIQDKVHFLFFGKIRPNKGVDTLIKAAQELGTKHKGRFRITIAGDAQNWEEYEALITEEDLFILEIGFVKNQRIVELFSHADYIVLPYKDMTQSGVVMVAYNYGVPVIASNLEEFHSYIVDGENGFLFDMGSVAALAEVMEKIILKQVDSFKIRKNLKSFIEKNISAEHISEKYAGFFETISREL